MNGTVLREMMKRDILSVIESYEKKYQASMSLTSGVLLEMLNEIKSLELQELLKWGMLNGNNAKKCESERREESRAEIQESGQKSKS